MRKATEATASAVPVHAPEPESGIHVRVVRTEFHPVAVGEGGLTFGQMVDQLIADSLERGDQIQSVEVEITDKDWAFLRNQY